MSRTHAKAPSEQCPRSEIIRILTALAAWAFLVLVVWVVLYGIWQRTPEMIPGSLRVFDAKIAALSRPGLFRADATNKVLFVGISHMITGLKPNQFDRLTEGGVSSFNMGLPVTLFGRHYHTLPEILEMLRASGQTPTHVLISWHEPRPPPLQDGPKSIWASVTPKFDSESVVRRLFPFRQIGRDGSIFLVRSLKHGGPAAFKKASDYEFQSVLRNRGYFFIKADSIFPNDELPDDYGLRSDTPSKPMPRDIEIWRQFAKALSLPKGAAAPKILLIPTYYRKNRCAPAPSNDVLRKALGPFGIHVIGPDYWQYPNRMFSDSAHLNPRGAEIYTRDLWDLVKGELN